MAKGDYVVIIDADMQDPPEIIPNMLEEMKKVGAEVIYGKRKKRKGESLFKKLTAKLFYRLLNKLSDVSFPPDAGDFKIITNKVLVSFNKLEEKNLYIRGLISWLGFKQVPYEYERDPRLAGETKYTMRKMLKLALNGLLGFSKKPLLLVVQLGFLIIILSFLLFLWILLGYFFSRYILVPGWTSNMVVIIFLGGVQLLSLGIVGLYIGNIFDEVKHRPNFIIEEEK